MKYYHYTSLDAFKKMLEKSIEVDKYGDVNLVLHATHSKFVNDPTETKLFKDALLRGVTQYAKIKGTTLSEKDIQKFNRYYSLEGVFIISLSSLEDNLVMWRTYGNNGEGVCLEFDFDLDPPFNKNRIMYNCVRPEHCKYVNPDTFAIDPEIIENTYEIIRGEQDVIQAAGEMAKGYRYGCIHKHSDYISEDEYRIVLTDESRMELKEQTLIPYRKYHIPIQTLKRVIIGPRLNYEYIENLFTIVMRVKNLTEIKICPSKVQYR